MGDNELTIVLDIDEPEGREKVLTAPPDEVVNVITLDGAVKRLTIRDLRRVFLSDEARKSDGVDSQEGN